MKKSTFLHLRFPFSFFLLPVFVFAAAMSKPFAWEDFLLVFFILHFLLYPASNGYNSYFDKDELSIGGLKTPPKVSQELYAVSLILDLLALLLGFLISVEFVFMLFVYGLVSKAYSHPYIRLKKRPVTGWLAAGVFQGYFTWLMVHLALRDLGFAELFDAEIQIAAGLSTLLLFGSYPMTQVYQHEEDGRRGDQTISLKLGILGTFHFTAGFFAIAVLLMCWFFTRFYTAREGLLFVAALFPVLVYFSWWYFRVRQDLREANSDRTMQLNLVSSACMNGYFAWLLWLH